MSKRMNGIFGSAAVACLAVLAGACGDGATGPGSNDPFDVQQSNQDFAVVEEAFAANSDIAFDMSFVQPLLQSMTSGAAIVQHIEVPSEPAVVSMARGTMLSAFGGSAAQPILPADVLGKTYEWSDTEAAYVQTTRTGAPANGFRVIVYDRTVNPFVEVGFVDVTDESSPAADRLDVTMVKDGLTRLDYTVEATQTTSSVQVTVDGYVTDGVQRVNFDILESASETSSGATVQLAYSLSLEGQPISVSLETTVSFGEQVAVDLTTTFVNGANTLVLSMSQAGEGALDGVVTWNGGIVMTVTDDGQGEPVFLGPEGEELTLAEGQAISEMFELAEEALFFLLANLAFLGAGLA